MRMRNLMVFQNFTRSWFMKTLLQFRIQIYKNFARANFCKFVKSDLRKKLWLFNYKIFPVSPSIEMKCKFKSRRFRILRNVKIIMHISVSLRPCVPLSINVIFHSATKKDIITFCYATKFSALLKFKNRFL